MRKARAKKCKWCKYLDETPRHTLCKLNCALTNKMHPDETRAAEAWVCLAVRKDQEQRRIL